MIKIDSICIVDDDPITVFGVRKMLSHVISCEDITSYSNGKQAIEGIKDRLKKKGSLPEIIFLDINMPIMDGWQFLEEFITLPAHEKVRVNIITSSIDSHDKEKWEQYQMLTDHQITYNQKPLFKEEIVKMTDKET